ncbi:TetR/AcrR family transcriptional regulator [Actinoalloteichus caeruleus]|uniref:Transcriptional regulator, TetR family n=1 Tax=Actinoalloteichus caeruleus DSM 43889 TaxID=1120930 RepID=A0ABT1JD54_ACTCY|nr:TetR/AcrR family transcriptional regulator [Actinoalloteichus caeruleus]MCP2330426.1 transcriptional regulator, TetR family [Actinoalloteichus caeruleus DSM 43889]
MAPENPGPADPARSLALLWRTSGPSGRRGRQGIDVEDIVRAAVDLADTEGLAALSMRRVAHQLGVGTMSLYTYVPGKDELVEAMVDAVYGELDLTAPAPGGWRRHLEAVARRNWELYQRHGWLAQVATGRAVLGPHAIAKYDHELRALDGIGLTDVEMDAVLTLVLGHVRTAARAAWEAARTEHRSGMSDEQWWAAHAPHLTRVLDPDRFPVAARVGAAAGTAHRAPHDPAHDFEFGLLRVLDGIEALVRTRTVDPGATTPR